MLLERGARMERANLFGGVGSVVVCDLLQGRPHPPFGAVLACELAPGGTVGRHRQEQLAEIIVGIRGEGTATVNGAEHLLEPGRVVHLPQGAVLSLANGSATEPLEYLIIKA